MDILTNFALFAGAGGLEIGARRFGGFRTVGYCEIDRYAQGVLQSRIRDGQLDDAPIWDDVTTFDGRPYRGLVDCVSGGFPCQDVSVAGARAGIIEGKRTGLFREIPRIICEIQPRFVLLENVPGLTSSGGIGTVLGALAEGGFDAEWWTLGADDVGAPHIRDRVWIVGYRRGLAVQSGLSDTERDFLWVLGQRSGKQQGEPRASVAGYDGEEGSLADAPLLLGPEIERSAEERVLPPLLADADGGRCEQRDENVGRLRERDEKSAGAGEGEVGDAECFRRRGLPRWWPGPKPADGHFRVEEGVWYDWSVEPDVDRVAHGVEFRVDRLRLVGNGVVPDASIPSWALIRKIHEAEKAEG